MKIVFLLEEPSMKDLLDVVLPKLIPETVGFQTVPHEGKTDLERSIPRKLRGWREPGVRFVVVRDNDGADCLSVKARLADLCRSSGRPDTLVRIVCQELECWYLGDLAAVEKAFSVGGLACKQQKAKYRTPDKLANSSDIMRKLIPRFAKVSGARAIAPHMSITDNRSASFHAFVRGVQRISVPQDV